MSRAVKPFILSLTSGPWQCYLGIRSVQLIEQQKTLTPASLKTMGKGRSETVAPSWSWRITSWTGHLALRASGTKNGFPRSPAF